MSYGKEVCYKSLVKAASHYRGEGNFCSVIALCVAVGCKFGKGRSILARELGRKNNTGTHGSSYGGRVKGQHDFVYPLLGKKCVELPMGRGFMVANSASRLPRHGTFLIYSSRHVTCLKDGILHDWTAMDNVKGKRMKSVYQVLDA